MSVTPEETLLRLGLALVFGGIVGLERQWHHKHAGVKTHTLVALGSTAFSLLSVLGLGPNSAPTQLAVGVVSGIGFIGGGVIMRRGGNIQGITTAATLWATASVGLCLGPGYYFLSSALFMGILAVQFAFRFIDAWVDGKSLGPPEDPTHRLSLSFNAAAEESIHKAVNDFLNQPGVMLCRSVQTRSVPLQWDLSLGLARPRYEAFGKLGRELTGLPEVLRVDFGLTAAPEEP